MMHVLLLFFPGNFLLCRKKDGSPQLGLIDFGTYGRIGIQDIVNE